MVLKSIIRYINQHRYVYFFGFGANREPDMVKSIIGHYPKIVAKNASINNYELVVQTLTNIPNTSYNPRQILFVAWGDTFKSYVIHKYDGKQVTGTLFKVTNYERKLIDAWELVPKNWQQSTKVAVEDTKNGKLYYAYTQTISQNSKYSYASNGFNYKSWLMPKANFIKIASNSVKKYHKTVF